MGPKKITLVLFVCTALLVTAIIVFPTNKQCPDFDQGIVLIDTQHKLSIAIARTPNQHTRGLSGCPAINSNQGMLFPFTQPTNAAFWMKNMLIPIDIIWIADDSVVGIEHNVPPPHSSQDPLPKYYPPQPVDYVLEIRAGQAKQLNIDIGSVIHINP